MTGVSAPHRPIMLAEVLRHLRPKAGDVAVDCTLGGGGHAQAILGRILPGGRLIGLDLDGAELSRTEARLRAEGFGPDACLARHESFAHLPRVLAAEAIPAADVILIDLGVSAMQVDAPARGFSYKAPGPLDMRMDQSRGETAAQMIARMDERELEQLLVSNADEPHAEAIARLLKRQAVTTTNGLERLLRLGLARELPGLSRAALKMSSRRTFQALRIAVNGELAALDALLTVLPACLAPGGRVAILTFHSGEDRRVKKALRTGLRAGVYSTIAGEVVRSTKAETFANRRAAAARLRWAVRARQTAG